MDLRGLAELLAPLFLGRLIHVVRNTDEKILFEKREKYCLRLKKDLVWKCR